ncbi:right-handed parallel beta-helix repeat-containing protein [Pedobacter psychrophilus]|uniref:right-handed parallel beta-helix repeat-containing protein n=1 Tax=Pedobacter psychrophilus TaxID=1826909 RepID=UPI0018E06145|nr:right-handed parallel beta-helix repeat-containing protein [Pedobacter psychrophilus]
MMNKLRILIVLLFSITIVSCQKNEFDKQRVDDKNVSGSQNFKTYYVSPSGNDASSGLSQSTPFRTFERAVSVTQPGDFVYFMDGSYIISKTISILTPGLPDNYITYAALAGAKPKFIAAGNIFDSININASYIRIIGLELQGNNANIIPSEALAAYNAVKAGGTPNGFFNTNGIAIGGPRTNSKLPHHVEVKDCIIHDFPGGGLGAIQADYVTFEGNTVYNNAWYSIYGQSGISILTPFNSDNSTGYKNIVRGNKCYGNKTTIPWIQVDRLSDGNGIIMDTNNREYNATSGTGYYTGRTLLENNVSFNNGGSGIHAFDFQHADIVNNTTYNNGLVVGYGNIYASTATDCKIMNNIMYAKPGGRVNQRNNSGGANVIYSNNIYFLNGGPAPEVMGTNDKIADPLFIALSADPAFANFQLQASSPAVNYGTSALFAAKDFLGIARPKGTAPDCGAYESF